MPEIIINDVPIDFPHPNPYNVQRTYMEKVIECLRDSKNGVLESPTGTGKTLSLLCSTLAWLKQKKDEAVTILTSRNSESHENITDEQLPNVDSMPIIPKIIYSSRTHTQLAQAIKELKGTSYSSVKVGVLASRDQLCLHPDLAFESNANKSEMCKSKTAMRLDPQTATHRCECSFYERFQTLQNDSEFRLANFEDKILDMEELLASGRENHYCSYYMSKTFVEGADIIFIPYNYLLDPKIRGFIGVELKDAIVILDEAHNVPQMCEDSASIEFKSSHIADAILEVAKIADFISENQRQFEPTTFNLSELNELKSIILRFKHAIDGIQLSRTDSNSIDAAEFDGSFIFAIMDTADIGYHTSRNITLLIKNALQYVSDCITLLRSSQNGSSSQLKLPNQSPGLRKFNEILWTTFASCGDDFREDIKKHYRVYVAYDKSPMLQSNLVPVKVVNYWCFSPKFALEYLLDKKHVRSIIFTSGTMSPLQPFITSLGIAIEVHLQNCHIIDRSQVLVEIISNGPDSEELRSVYSNRWNLKYFESLGNTVLKLSQVIPDGLLIFFPSYALLNLCKTRWQNKGIWSQIEQVKPVFVEPKFKVEFAITMKNYYKKINDSTTNGAIFMAVCRGKVSEGLDFANKNGRAVIITGIPFAPKSDPKVGLKKSYMQTNYIRNQSLSGDEWYQLEASRAVNQAIGRVIRHRYDYGAILLCDCRFNEPIQKSQLSQWLKRHIRNDRSRRSFDSITNSISQFFETQQLASLEVNSSTSAVMSEDTQAAMGIIDEESTHGQTTTRTTIDFNDSHQATTSYLVESPTTSFLQQIAALPLSSPSLTPNMLSTTSSPSSSSNRADSNGTPSKQRCFINLSALFNEENQST